MSLFFLHLLMTLVPSGISDNLALITGQNVSDNLFGVYYTVVGTGHFYVSYVKFNGAIVSNMGNLGDASWSGPTSLAICDSQPYWPYRDQFGNTELRMLGSDMPKKFNYPNGTICLTCSTNASILYAVTCDLKETCWFAKIDIEKENVTTLLPLPKASNAADYDNINALYYIGIDNALITINVHTLEVKTIKISCNSDASSLQFSGLWVHKNNNLIGFMRDQFGPIHVVLIDPIRGSCQNLVTFSNTSDLVLSSFAFSRSEEAVYMMQGYDNQPTVGFYRLGIDGTSTKLPLDPSHHPSDFAALIFTR